MAAIIRVCAGLLVISIFSILFLFNISCTLFNLLLRQSLLVTVCSQNIIYFHI